MLANQGLVRKLIVAKFGPAAADDEDLNQAGLVGLVLAVVAYEQDRIKDRFSTFARAIILREVINCDSRVTSKDRLSPRRRRSERAEILRHVDSLTRTLGRLPDSQEVIASWPGPRPPHRATVERALLPEPVLLYQECGDKADPRADDTLEIEDLLDAKRRFDRLPHEVQEQLRGGRG